MLSRDDIIAALTEGHLKIYPFNKKDLTGIGYNLSTTNFAFSINKGILLTVHQRTTANGLRRYVVISGNDTVLFFSKEYIAVDNTLAGTFHSKVARVCQGLGHISTTLDPTWKGQLIISVNNPTSEAIVFELDKLSGNIFTLLLHKLDTPVTGQEVHDNNRGRCDLLLEHFSKPSTGKKYKIKHLELQDFIVNEFANSLNGYDNFLDNHKYQDKYSDKITKIFELKKRLETDNVLINESRYSLGENGTYRIFRNNEEEQLFTDCAISKIKEKLKHEYEYQDITNNTLKITNLIGHILYVLDYELDMMNHIRRIEWQNDKIKHFADEESEFVKERKREDMKSFRRKLWIPIALIIAMFAALLFAIIKVDASNKNYSTIIVCIVTVIAPILTLFLERWFKAWKEQKARAEAE